MKMPLSIRIKGVIIQVLYFKIYLKEAQLGQSMSRRGNCWDNAPQESFFGHMKDEIKQKSCKTLKN